MKKEQKYLELWGDLVGSIDMVQAIVVSTVLTIGGYFLAPSQDTTKQLFFGLMGAVLALFINTLFIKPKRIIRRATIDK